MLPRLATGIPLVGARRSLQPVAMNSTFFRRRTGAQRALWTGAINISYLKRPTVIFTAGAPGSGKTYTVNRLFGLDNVEMIDLDKAISKHPEFQIDAPRKVYEKAEAYRWADERVEEMYAAALQRGAAQEGVKICVDGTGTNIERQLRRMRDARAAEFWVVAVYVRVRPEVCFERNERRKRKVPRRVIIDYLDKLDGAVGTVLDAGLVDEYISLDNSAEDSFRSEDERWGESRQQVEGASATNRSFFDYESTDIDPEPFP